MRGSQRGGPAKQMQHVRAITRAKRQAKRPNRAWLILVVVTMSVLILGFVTAEILHAPINPKWEITMFYLVLVTALLVTEMRNKTRKWWSSFWRWLRSLCLAPPGTT